MLIACNRCVLKENQAPSLEEISVMTNYIPQRLIQILGESPCCIFEKKVEKLQGFVVYFDIVEFTQIVSGYSKDGGDVGTLSHAFSDFFSQVTETISEAGASVFQTAGDSLLISFEQLPGESQANNCLRALESVRIAFQQIEQYNLKNSGRHGFSLIPKIGIGYGSFYQLLLGEDKGFVTPIITGYAVKEAVLSEENCCGGEILLGENAWLQAKQFGIGKLFQQSKKFYAFIGKDTPIVHERYIEKYDRTTLFQNERYFNRIRSFINPIIYERITSSIQGFSGEYREISCVMLRFSETTDGKILSRIEQDNIEWYERLNQIHAFVYTKALQYSGFRLKPDLSDKGAVFPVLFGAVTALEQKEKNALLFAKDILENISSLPFFAHVSIGISTGTLYCGEFGGNKGKDFSVVGSSVIFAARLMMQDVDTILLDASTMQKTSSFSKCHFVDSIMLKGYESKQEVYQFDSTFSNTKRQFQTEKLIGRDNEMHNLLSIFHYALNGHAVALTVMGDAGMGKSFLAESFIKHVEMGKDRIHILRGNCYPYEEATLFYPWRMILTHLLGLAREDSNEELLVKMQEVFSQVSTEQDYEWIPFFLNMLGFILAEEDNLKELDVSIKQEKFFSLVYKILWNKAKIIPLLIVIEDIHWADSVSLRMMEYFILRVEKAPIFLLALSRNEEKITSFCRNSNINQLKLAQLNEDSARQLIIQLLNLKDPDISFVSQILRTSDGNPFFMENIVQNMQANKVLIAGSDGFNQLSQDVRSIEIPSSIQSIILSRLNTLLFEEQVVFKTASVIGRTFYTDMLKELVPRGIDQVTVVKALERFEYNNLVLAEAKDISYCFKHISIREVVYYTILESTRKELNKLLLQYLEKRCKQNIQPIVERLEYHAREAGEQEKVFQYAQIAAEKSEQQYALLDAVEHYETALTALEKIEREDMPQQRFSIKCSLAAANRKCSKFQAADDLYREIFHEALNVYHKAAARQGLGQCFHEQGLFDEAVVELEAALTLLGEKPPETLFATYRSIFKELFSQLLQSVILYKRKLNVNHERTAKLKLKGDILVTASKLYYFGHIEKVAWAAVNGYNNAKKLVENQEILAMRTADYAFAMISAGLTKAGLHFFNIAEETAIRSGNRTALNFFKSRYAYYFMYHSENKKSIELLEEACSHFRNIGENWELMTALGALGQNYFLISRFDEAAEAYLDTASLAEKLKSPMHIGWSYNKVPFIRYLTGVLSAKQAMDELEKGIRISSQVNDHMTLCIHYGHLAYIAMKEKNAAAAVKYAKKILQENTLYKVNIPHIKISYVNAAEAAIFAMEEGFHELSSKALSLLVRTSLRKALKQAKLFKLIEGPAYRALARYSLFNGNSSKAQQHCLRALSVFDNSEFYWEHAETLLIAARCFPEKTDEYSHKAAELFEKHSIVQY